MVSGVAISAFLAVAFPTSAIKPASLAVAGLASSVGSQAVVPVRVGP